MATLSIRALESSDLDDLLALYAHLHRQDSPSPGMAAVQATWQAILANPYHSIFGGYADGELVGSCALTIVPNLTRACRPYGVIENVVTHAGHRNKGYGRAVLARALEYAWGADCYKVMLLTGKKDESTMRFYEGAGFDGDEKRGFTARPTRVNADSRAHADRPASLTNGG